VSWIFPDSRAVAFRLAKSRCVHASPAVSSCARTYSGQRPGRTCGPANRLWSGCAGHPVGPSAGLSAIREDHWWRPFWPTHSPQNASAGAAPTRGHGISWRTRRGCCRPLERCGDDRLTCLATCHPGPRGGAPSGRPAKHPLASVSALWGSRTRPPVLTWASTRLARIR
jgi:hypothetical protein